MSHVAAYTDEQLLPLLKAGDRAAFSVIYRRHFQNLYQRVASLVKDARLSEDIVQEIFVDLWHRHESLMVRSTLGAYLSKAARYKVIDHFRSEKLRKDYAAEFSAFVSAHNNVEEVIRMRELQQSIDYRVSQLPARMQMVFRLSRYEHVPIPEIAKRMQISVSTVNDQLTKALARLRESLGEFMVLLLWLMQ